MSQFYNLETVFLVFKKYKQELRWRSAVGPYREPRSWQGFGGENQ